MLRLSDFVTCRKRYYNQDRGYISQLWKTLELKFRTYLLLRLINKFFQVVKLKFTSPDSGVISLTFTEGNQQICLLSRSGKSQNNVNFPILVREIEIKCLFPLVVIQNTTENLKSFRNMVFTGRGHLDYDERP